jgi:hypothetical protein
MAGHSHRRADGRRHLLGTTQNRRSRGEIPDDSYARSGTRVLVIRDPFLDWWATTLADARLPPVVPAGQPPRRQRRNRADEFAGGD